MAAMVKDCPHCRAQGYLEPTTFFVREGLQNVLVEAIHCLICGWLVEREQIKSLMVRPVTAEDFQDDRILVAHCQVAGCPNKINRVNQSGLCGRHQNSFAHWQRRYKHLPDNQKPAAPIVKIGGCWFERRGYGRG